MRTALPTENLDVAFYNEREPFEETGAVSNVTRIPVVEQDLLNRPRPRLEIHELFKMYEPLIGFSRIEKTPTSAVAMTSYSARWSAPPQYEITKDAEDFISRQKKAVKYRRDIFAIVNSASEFLKKEKIPADVSISLFVDPEYRGWTETKIRIVVPRDSLERTYNVYDKLLTYSFKGIHMKTLRKLFVTIESR